MITSISDVLLYMVSYPNRTPRWALEEALQISDLFGARLSGLLCQTHIPAVGNWLTDKLAHVDALVGSENTRSREAAADLMAEFSSLVDENRRGEQILVECGPIGYPEEPARLARTHDLSVVPVETNIEYRVAAEELIFDSGRPVLLLPRPTFGALRLDDVIIGWDGSKSAARALAAALPFCIAANSVRVIAVTGEKPLDWTRPNEEVRRHLAYHNIACSTEDVAAAGRDAGAALMEYGIESGADILVIGAYGHSRTREFVLGGATRSVLDDPRLPTLLTH